MQHIEQLKNISTVAKSAATVNDTPATPPAARHLKLRALLRRRSLWLVGALLVIGAGAFGYHWAFGKAKPSYATAAVTRGDIESTVVAAGIVQPLKYVDVGAQTSGKLKSLKVNRGDQVETNQLLAEIDPVLADTALTSADAALESMTAQHALKQAQLVLAKVQETRNDELFAQQLISTSDRDVTKAAYDVAFADAASLTAQMKEAAAAIETGKANLGYTKITAPMAGEVVSISLLEGQTLNANQQAPNILRLADINDFVARVEPDADMSVVQAGLHTLLMKRHRTEDFNIRNMADTIATANATQNTLTYLLAAIAVISLVVGGIGVMNIMLVSVTERTREIGIRMAIGARSFDVLFQFLTEAVMVCFIGGLAGIVVGIGGGLATSAIAGWRVIFTVTPIVIAFACAFLTGIIFGYLPARKAAQLDPIEALARD